jgi:hypothetical protein
MMGKVLEKKNSKRKKAQAHGLDWARAPRS